MSVTRITELSSVISTNTAKLDKYFASKNLPTPSFDADVSPRLLLDPAIAEARKAIIEATDELQALMQGPIGILTTPAVGLILSLCYTYSH